MLADGYNGELLQDPSKLDTFSGGEARIDDLTTDFLSYTSDATDEGVRVDPRGRRLRKTTPRTAALALAVTRWPSYL